MEPTTSTVTYQGSKPSWLFWLDTGLWLGAGLGFGVGAAIGVSLLAGTAITWLIKAVL